MFSGFVKKSNFESMANSIRFYSLIVLFQSNISAPARVAQSLGGAQGRYILSNIGLRLFEAISYTKKSSWHLTILVFQLVPEYIILKTEFSKLILCHISFFFEKTRPIYYRWAMRNISGAQNSNDNLNSHIPSLNGTKPHCSGRTLQHLRQVFQREILTILVSKHL